MENTSIDKDRFKQNVNYLLQKSDKKIGEIENLVGVSQGYFSKLFKADNKQMPALETVARLADCFEITIDSLLYSEYPFISRADAEMDDLISTLIKKTRSEDVIWEEEDFEELKRVSQNTGHPQYHPIFDLTKTMNDAWKAEEEVPETGIAKDYPLDSDLFKGVSHFLEGSCYKLQISNEDYLYLLKTLKFEELIDEWMTFYVLIIDRAFKDEFQNPLREILVEDRRRELSPEQRTNTIQALYMTISQNWGKVHISQEAAASLSDFLKRLKNGQKDEDLDSLYEDLNSLYD